MGSGLLSRMREYSRRLSPLLAGRILAMDPRLLPKTIDVDPREIAAQLVEVLRLLDHRFAYLSFLDVHRNRSADYHERARQEISEALFDHLGFELVRGPSTVCDGRGILVTRGSVPARALSCLYPGTIYYPGDPILLQSIANSFILQCREGMMVDGKDSGLSGLIFRSCSLRDLSPFLCDLSWLTPSPLVFLNLGHYVNDSRHSPGSVQYVDVEMPPLSPSLRRWLPYCSFRSPLGGVWESGLVVVCLVSTRRIREGEELLSDYLCV